MKNLLIKVLKNIISQKFIMYLIKKCADIYWIDFRLLYYQQQGILKYQNDEISGEKFFIDNILSNYLTEKSIIFDVGANIGNFALSINKKNNLSNIYCFEPNPFSYSLLQKNMNPFKNIYTYNIGFGEIESEMEMYIYEHAKDTEHASIYKTVMSEFHKAQDIQAINISINTIDSFCENYNITQIDFLKIDTEGYELNVLKGAKNMIETGRINIIQFEFNEMNIASRVFLKDFYEILKKYEIYRIDTKRLIPLPFYMSYNEVFQFQNYVAFLKK